jgi:hypothetical protein
LQILAQLGSVGADRCAIGFWRHPDESVKCRGHVGLRGESARIGHLSDGCVTVKEQLSDPVNPSFQDVPMRCDANAGFELPREIEWARLRDSGERDYRKVSFEIGMDVLNYL